MGMPQVVIYCKPGCCLCARVKGQLETLQERYEFTLREVNILENSETYNTFKDEIPVICINGRQAFKYRLNETRFIRILESFGHSGTADS